MLNGQFISPLSRKVLTISGPDRQTFLHALCTNDINTLAEGEVRPNALCTPAGRVLANFLMWQDEDTIHLLVTESLAQSLCKTFLFYRLNAKIDIQMAHTWASIGIAGRDSALFLQKVELPVPEPFQAIKINACTLIGLPNQRYLVVGDSPMSLKIQAQEHGLDLAPAERWEWLDIRDGWPTLTPETQGKFVAQQINLDLLGAIHFQKGCYPGQEVIARVQHLSKNKKRMMGFHQAAEGTVTPGDAITYENEAIGEIVHAEANPAGGTDLLVVMSVEDLDKTPLLSPVGPLETPFRFPYEVPEQEPRPA